MVLVDARLVIVLAVILALTCWAAGVLNAALFFIYIRRPKQRPAPAAPVHRSSARRLHPTVPFVAHRDPTPTVHIGGDS